MPNRPGLRLPSWKDLEKSLLLRMGGAIAAIAMLAVLGMTVSGLVAESTQGSGEAINLTGSLRMQSWQMTSLYLSDPEASGLETRAEMLAAIAAFDRILESPSIRAMLPQGGDGGLARAHETVRQAWFGRIPARTGTKRINDHAIRNVLARPIHRPPSAGRRLP